MTPRDGDCQFQGVEGRCGKQIDPELDGPFCCPRHKKRFVAARRAKHSRRYHERHPGARDIRNAFDRINTALSQQGNFPFPVRLWWRVELPHRARQQFKNITALLPDAGYARRFAQDIQNHFQLSRKPRVKADYAIVVSAAFGKQAIQALLPQLDHTLHAVVEGMLRTGEQPLFAGHMVFYEDPKALLNAYRALLQAPERHMREVALRVRV